MFNAVDSPQSILILGGSSEIGLAIASEFLVRGPARVILAVVPGDPTADAAARDGSAASAVRAGIAHQKFSGRASSPAITLPLA